MQKCFVIPSFCVSLGLLVFSRSTNGVLMCVCALESIFSYSTHGQSGTPSHGSTVSNLLTRNQLIAMQETTNLSQTSKKMATSISLGNVGDHDTAMPLQTAASLPNSPRHFSRYLFPYPHLMHYSFPCSQAVSHRVLDQ